MARLYMFYRNKMDTKALFNIGYGLYVLTTNYDNIDNGCIVNTVIQVTSNPLQIAVTVNKGNYTHDLIKDSCVLNVSMLTTETPMKVFEHFGFQSGRKVNKFADCESEHRAVNHVLYIPKYTNAYLACRVTKSIDFGTHTMFIADVLDAQVLSDKPSVTYDYYNRQTRDMLYRGSLCLTGGMSYYFNSDDPANTIPVYFNAGMVENQGHELSLGWKDRKRDFSYGVSVNMSFNTNLVKQVGDRPGASTIDKGLDASWPLLARTEDGYAMSMFYGYKVLGIFQNQAEVDHYNQYALDSWRADNPNHPYGYAANGQPLTADGKEMGIYYQTSNTGVGDLIYDDNGVGRVTPASRRYIGNPWPKMTMGLNINLAYKGFDLALVFQGAFGFEIMNLIKPYTHMFMSDNTTAAIFTTSCFGKGNTTVTKDPRVGFLNEHNSVIGDGAANRNYSTVSGYLVEKGDYLKLKNLSIGYTLPQKYSRKAKPGTKEMIQSVSWS